MYVIIIYKEGVSYEENSIDSVCVYAAAYRMLG